MPTKGDVTVENVLMVAAYVYNRYSNTYGNRIDEMKLHNLIIDQDIFLY